MVKVAIPKTKPKKTEKKNSLAGLTPEQAQGGTTPDIVKKKAPRKKQGATSRAY